MIRQGEHLHIQWILVIKLTVYYVISVIALETQIFDLISRFWREILQRQDGGLNFQAERSGLRRNLETCVYV